VATFSKSKISVVANFRDKEDAKRFVRMMRMSGKGPDIGICVCESKTPLWSPLDNGIQPPQQKSDEGAQQ
jgi:hypothetical protein